MGDAAGEPADRLHLLRERVLVERAAAMPVSRMNGLRTPRALRRRIRSMPVPSGSC